MPPGNLGSQEGQGLNCAAAIETRPKAIKSFMIRFDGFDCELKIFVNRKGYEKEDTMCRAWGKELLSNF